MLAVSPQTVSTPQKPVIPAPRGYVRTHSKSVTDLSTPGVAVNKTGSYKLLQTAQRLLHAVYDDDHPHAIEFCSKIANTNGQGAQVHYHDHKEKAHYSNIKTCSNVWACPVCSRRIMAERREILEHVIQDHKEQGGSALLVTVTIQHSIKDELSELLNAVVDAWRLVQGGWQWTKFKRGYGVVGSVSALEMTWSMNNGWHPHKHILLLLDHKTTKAEIDEIREFISVRYIEMAARNARYVSASWGVDVAGGDGAAKYISKWGEADEMTSTRAKTGKGVSPFGLLELYGQGNKRAGARYIEYVQATFGQRRLFRSRSLKDAYETAEADIQEERQAEEKPRLALVLDIEQWVELRKQSKRDALLLKVEACKGDYWTIWKFLVEECGIKYDSYRETQLLENIAENAAVNMPELRRVNGRMRFVNQCIKVHSGVVDRQAEYMPIIYQVV